MTPFQDIISNSSAPILSALLIGVMTSISPCPLATNITAIAYISKDIKDSKKVLSYGFIYTLGRAFTYTLIAILIYVGLSAFSIQSLFQTWGDKVLGPLMILIGLFMLEVIKINLSSGNRTTEKIQTWLQDKGALGAFLLGVLFALAFCPYSGVMFFGMLMPIVISSNNPVLAPLAFSFGTGIPVIFFSFMIAYSAKKLGDTFTRLKNIEVWIRKIAGVIFILAGIYYLRYLVEYIISIV